MKIDYLKDLREKKELVSVVLLGVSAFLAVLILVKVTGFFTAPAKAELLVKKAIAQNNAGAEDVDKYFAKYKALANELKKNNLFAPPSAKQHPVKEVWGIFGNEAFINGKWYKAGDKVADAKIVAVNPTSVETLWDGKKKTFRPFDSGVASGPGGSSRPGRPTANSRGSRSSSGKGPQMVVIKSSTGTGFRMGGMREMHDIVSEIQREKLRREMEKTREKYMHMSETERAKFKVEMLEKLSRERSK